MNAITVRALDARVTSVDRRSLWHRRVVEPADLAGVLVAAVPLLLGVYLAAGLRQAETVVYALCVVAALPHVGPFIGSMRRHPATTALIGVFVALTVATAAASLQDASNVVLQAKGLAATAVWASVYAVAFSTVRTGSSLLRLTRWIRFTCIAISASVYLCAILHVVGIPFGEFLEFRDGSFRAFGPLGDQVSFVLVLPALIALAESRPAAFGIHFGSLLLTATRGAFLSLLVGVVAYLILLGSRKVRVRSALWALAPVAVAMLIMISPAASTITERITSSPTDQSYSFRWTAVMSGLSVVADHPLLGVGFNGFADRRRAIAEDWLATTASENGLSRASNQFVQTTTDGGVFAGLALILFCALTVRNAWRAIGWRDATPEFVGVQLWVIAFLIGNQGALWLLSDAVSGFFVFAVAAMATRGAALARSDNDAAHA